MKVAVALSGGVDSSVAAAVLQKEGYQVIGITLRLGPADERDAAEAAGAVVRKLGIPHYVIDFRDIFAREVITPFCQEYRRGRTPNPCIHCNRYIKFGAFREKAGELSAGLVASGHYARVEEDGGRYLLKKGLDWRKDQSYMLYTLNQEQLESTLLPIGNFTKERVREIAGELALPVAARPESQEICFIPDDDYPGFLKEYMPRAAVPGPILDKQGNTLGEHRGILFYTVGQRKRLGISAKEPRYVTAILPEENAIVVGGKEELYGDELVASGLNWVALTGLEEPVLASAKIRYRHHAAAAEIIPVDGDRVRVRFTEPQMAITPGQAVVFYRGETVLGGGTIERAVSRSVAVDTEKLGAV